MSEKKEYCCEDFKKGFENGSYRHLMIWDKNHIPTTYTDESRFEIFGYDMDKDYPPLNYCPSCGAKL